MFETTSLLVPSALRSEHSLHGSLPDYMSGRLSFLSQAVKSHGDFVTYRLGLQHTYLINSPAAARAVLSEWVLVDNALTDGWLFLDQSYLAVHGRARSQPRALLHSSICPMQVLPQIAEVARNTSQHVARWQPDQPLDLLSSMMELSLDSISLILFGTPARAWLGSLFDSFADIQVLGGAYTASATVRAKLEVSRRQSLFEELVARVDEVLQSPSTQATPTVSKLLLAQQFGTLTRMGLIHELCVLLLSHGSAGLLAMNTLQLLARHERVRSALEHELQRELSDAPVTHHSLASLSYLDKVLFESMRLYPPIGLIPRLVVADYENAGLQIPKGSQVHISPYLLHRHRAFWDEPDQFWPERFDATPKASWNANKAFMPFGHSIRRCIGDQLALLQVKTMLATLMRQARLDLPSSASLDYDLSPLGALYPTQVAMPAIVRGARVAS